MVAKCKIIKRLYKLLISCRGRGGNFIEAKEKVVEAAKAEAVQTNFARTVLGLQGQRALTHTFMRAELGLEKLASRWEKLRLGYWRRIQAAKPDRALAIVAAARRRQLRWEGGAELSWMKQTRVLLRERGLEEYWATPNLTTTIDKDE